MIADPVKELDGLIEGESDNSEPQMPGAIWLSDVLRTVSSEVNEPIDAKDEAVDEGDEPTVYHPLLPLEMAEQTKFALVLRCFDTWTRTVLTGAVAGSVFGGLYVLLH